MLRVVDASVAAKWFIPELHKAKAETILREYLTDAAELVAPDLFIAEVGNILWKRSARGDITMDHALESYRNLLSLNIPLHPCSQLAARALRLALAERRTVYDMMYLALADQSGCRFITADERLVNALAKKFPCLQWIGDV